MRVHGSELVELLQTIVVNVEGCPMWHLIFVKIPTEFHRKNLLFNKHTHFLFYSKWHALELQVEHTLSNVRETGH